MLRSTGIAKLLLLFLRLDAEKYAVRDIERRRLGAVEPACAMPSVPESRGPPGGRTSVGLPDAQLALPPRVRQPLYCSKCGHHGARLSRRFEDPDGLWRLLKDEQART